MMTRGPSQSKVPTRSIMFNWIGDLGRTKLEHWVPKWLPISINTPPLKTKEATKYFDPLLKIYKSATTWAPWY